MNAAALGARPRLDRFDGGELGAVGEIAEAADIQRLAAAARPDLQQGAEEASLAAPDIARDPVLMMVGRVLGARLTTDNLAWRGDPVPVMRSLQKMLVAHSLAQEEDQRQPALGAIRAVELAVRWRLRWMQMRRSEAESHFIEPQQDNHARAPSA